MLDAIKKFMKPGLDVIAETTGWRVIPDRLAHPRSKNVCTLDVPGYRQLESYTCGFAAGLIVLHTFYPRRSIRRLFDLVGSDYNYGTQNSTLVKSLRASGVGVGHRDDLTFAKICRAIDDGFPIITLVGSTDPEVEHWVVLYGYGRKPNRVFIAGATFCDAAVAAHGNSWGTLKEYYR